MVHLAMWRIGRSDAVTVWSNEIVTKRLTRYRSIIDLKLLARYLLARNLSVEFELSDSISTLWKIHKQAQTRFQKELTQNRKKKLNEEDIK